MKNILNMPAEVLALDVNDTLIMRGVDAGLVPVTNCLPDALAEAQHTMKLFLASNHTHAAAVQFLDQAGIPTHLFTAPSTSHDSLPSHIFRAVFSSHPDAIDSDAYGKVIGMYHMLATLGITEEHILEAISGKRRFEHVVSFGDSHTDRLAADVFGFRHGNVTQLGEGHTLSSVVRGIHHANSKYEGPKWLAAGRPIQSTISGPSKMARA
ncbi:MAG: hypothetical protein ABID61_03615 [Candidatus Micrarchaeota archaeon]